MTSRVLVWYDHNEPVNKESRGGPGATGSRGDYRPIWIAGEHNGTPLWPLGWPRSIQTRSVAAPYGISRIAPKREIVFYFSIDALVKIW